MWRALLCALFATFASAAAAVPVEELVSEKAAESRDPKGLYKKARAGEIKNFTGIDDPYEAPFKPEIHLHSDQQSLAEEVQQILSVLRERGIISQ